MKIIHILKIIITLNLLNISFSFSHELPSHFANHEHQSDPKYERPYIRVKNEN